MAPSRFAHHVAFVVCVLASVSGSAESAAAQSAPRWASDPIYVFYPRGECRGESVDLEVWDREGERWRRHPGHPRVALETCQIEDAGRLLNELRWRCVESEDGGLRPEWVVGIDVFDPMVMQRCAVDDRIANPGDLQFHLRTPTAGSRVTAEEMAVPVEGSVWMGGMEGDEYDVLIGIDRSAETQQSENDLLHAQVEAARRFIRELEPRLGRVRVGLYSYPNMPPLPGTDDDSGARSEIAFTSNPLELAAALDRVLARRASGFQTFRSALDHGIERLGSPLAAGAARPGARRVLILAANANRGRPFGSEAAVDRRFHAQLMARLVEAKEARVSVHLFAIGGLAERLAPKLHEVIEQHDARFYRVVGPALATAFLSGVELPVVTRVELANRTAGAVPQATRSTPSGRFTGSVPVLPGENRVWARATLSDGAVLEHEWSFEFDDAAVKALWLSAERERMRQVRQRKQLEVRPEWDAERAPSSDSAP